MKLWSPILVAVILAGVSLTSATMQQTSDDAKMRAPNGPGNTNPNGPGTTPPIYPSLGGNNGQTAPKKYPNLFSDLAKEISDLQFPLIVNGVPQPRKPIPAQNHCRDVLQAANHFLSEAKSLRIALQSYNKAYELEKYLPMAEKDIMDLWTTVPYKPTPKPRKEESKPETESNSQSSGDIYSDDYIAEAARKKFGAGASPGKRPGMYHNEMIEEVYDNPPQGDSSLKSNGAAGPTANGKQVKGARVTNTKNNSGRPAPSRKLADEDHDCSCNLFPYGEDANDLTDYNSLKPPGFENRPRPPFPGGREDLPRPNDGNLDQIMGGDCCN